MSARRDEQLETDGPHPRGEPSPSAPSALRRALDLLTALLLTEALLSMLALMMGWRGLVTFGGGVAMQFNTAFGLLLLGLGLEARKRRRVSLQIGSCLLLLLLATLTLVEYAAGLSLGIDVVLGAGGMGRDTVFAGRPSLNTTVAFLVLVLASLLDQRSDSRWSVAPLLASAALCMAVAALYGHVFGLRWTYGWGSWAGIGMSIPTALGVLLAATVFIGRAWISSSERPPRWAPAMCGFVVIAISVLLDEALIGEGTAEASALVSLGFALLMGGSLTLLLLALIKSREAQVRAEREAARRQAAVAQLQGVFHQSFGFLAVLDPGGLVREANDTFTAAIGVNAGALDGRAIEALECWREESEVVFRRAMDEAEAGRAARFTLAFRDDRGRGGSLDASLKPIFGRENTLEAYVFEARDVSEIQRMSQLFQAAFESSGEGRCLVGLDQRIVRANSRLESCLGYEEGELEGARIETLVPEWIRDRHPELVESYFRDPRQRILGDRGKLTSRTKSGRTLPVEVGLAPVEIEGKLHVQVSVVDLSERQASEELFRALFEKASDGLILYDDESGVLQCNAAAVQLLGLPDHRDLIGHWPFEFSPDKQGPGTFSEQEARANEEKSDEEGGHRFDWVFLRPDGETVPCEVALRTVSLPAGPARLVVFHDISDRLSRERQLAAFSRRLQQANHDLEEFASVASHDLKAPLRAISSLSSWVLEDAGELLPDESREHLTTLRSRVVRMAGLLDALLDYARAGHRGQEVKEVELRALFHGIVEILAVPPRFRIQVEAELPVLRLPVVPLETCVRNLIENALKHHDRPDGRIDVKATLEGRVVQIEVIDDGPGIPEEHHQRVFGVFQTLKRRDEVEASGMGLALVRKTVTSYGGSIRLESEGRGSRFTLRWPIAREKSGYSRAAK